MTPATEVHHKQAKVDGGIDDPESLIATCGPCHEAADRANRGFKQPRRIGADGYPVSDE